jgi:hypothetical protein
MSRLAPYWRRWESDMSDWYVFSLDADGRDAQSRAQPTEDAALTHARDLKRQKHVVNRIEGPNGKVLDKNEIERRLASNP